MFLGRNEMLEGKLVNLRVVEKGDLEEIMKWVNKKEITKYLSYFLYPISQEEEEKFIEKALRHNDSEKNLVIETKDKEYLGQINLHNIDWKNMNAELGIVIGKEEYWNKGYGADAIKTLLDYAFHQLNLYKVYLRVFEYNERGIRCYQKCGFKEERRLRKSHFFERKFYDVIIMGLLKEEFESQVNQR